MLAKCNLTYKTSKRGCCWYKRPFLKVFWIIPFFTIEIFFPFLLIFELPLPVLTIFLRYCRTNSEKAATKTKMTTRTRSIMFKIGMLSTLPTVIRYNYTLLVIAKMRSIQPIQTPMLTMILMTQMNLITEGHTCKKETTMKYFCQVLIVITICSNCIISLKKNKYYIRYRNV